jgi:DNA-binding MarR family transcriptional regulator
VLTEPGVTLLREQRDHRVAIIESALSVLSAEDRSALYSSLPALRNLVELLGERLSVGVSVELPQ